LLLSFSRTLLATTAPFSPAFSTICVIGAWQARSTMW
jgi:hypothetical protein